MTTEGPHAAVVVVGAGHAGFTVASQLRTEGYEGSITLVDEQGRLPYQRPPLSKAYLNGDLPADELPFRGAVFYERERIDYLAGEGVVTIDRAARSVVTTTDRTLRYDALVLATGATPIRPPMFAPGIGGVLELRSIEDADGLAAALRGARRVVVVGGGFIGLEVACAARKHGLAVDVVELRDRVMARAVGPTVSAYAVDAHRAMGITVHLGAGVTTIDTHDGRVRGVTLATGQSIPADLVVLGVGIAPRTELAEKAGLDVDNGIVVNEFLETSDPAISAIGDCCSFPYFPGGRRVRLESVQNATDQARNLAKRLSGTRTPYTDLPWFWSDQGGLKLQMAGVGGAADREVVHGDPASGKFSVLRFDGDRLVCGESVNSSGDHVSLRTVVAHGRDEEVVRKLRSEPGTADLRQLARSLRRRSYQSDQK
ncbi:NAD(P)/FAD-dependent oxidoreductase [Amycolatopsis pigmentata]|uniref:NAD(P)/FAD-dependent oxidoreductase n=1 Tax=Amycolatopsis pigmentata TaxID=450801 RepID=A0ABW5FQJ6_9PSEU